ncbi:MAG: glycosyltransferase family 9 protein [Acidobacteria bacterium]|nr:glycosyltransferase family 9 protein [Acidobacteriota bacterium]
MKILLVRLRLIGDVVFTTPLVHALRRTYPEAHLTYVVEPLAAPVVRDNPHLDTVLVVPKRSGVARWRDDLWYARRLRAERFDVAIDLHGGPRSAWLTWASGAAMRVGYRMTGHSWMYTHVVDRSDDLLPRHSVVKQWDLLAPLGVGACDPARDAVEMPADPEADARIAGVLRNAGVGPLHPLIVLHVSAGNPFRRWPPEAFAALVVDLARRDPARRFMLTSGPSDAGAARAIVDRAGQHLGAAVTAVSHGQFGVSELRALAARAAVYIGGDSGPLHIAATTRTPIVALFGPTLPERSMPWRDSRWFAEAVDAGALPCRPCHQRTCQPGDFRCLTRIAPERVAAAAERALASAERRPSPDVEARALHA